jgi:hypothetical protein
MSGHKTALADLMIKTPTIAANDVLAIDHLEYSRMIELHARALRKRQKYKLFTSENLSKAIRENLVQCVDYIIKVDIFFLLQIQS